MTRNVVIVDIDNVYMVSSKWEKGMPAQDGSREEWDAFLRMYDGKVAPNKPVIEMICRLATAYPIHFVTAREDRMDLRKLTIRDIRKFSANRIKIGKRNKLYMREENDMRSSAEVKEDILTRHIIASGYLPILVFDDCKYNLDMFAKYNIPTLHYSQNSLVIE